VDKLQPLFFMMYFLIFIIHRCFNTYKTTLNCYICLL
jgi:hypothetical protein